MDKGSPPASEHAGPALRVLGGLTLRTGGREVSFGRSIRARRLLAALVINRGELVTADRLAQVTWGEALPADPRAATHNLISRLRTLIGDDSGIEVMTRVPGYVLAAQPGAVDATVFEDQVRAARQEADPQRSLAQLDAALALWRGPAYADFADEEFARVEARRLTLLGQAAQEDRIDRMLALGLNDDAVLLLERAVAADPLRERPRMQLMTALYRSGSVADALACARGYRQIMREELGLEPGSGVSDLEIRILRRDVTLRLSSAWSSASEGAGAPAAPPATSEPAEDVAAARRSLVGREEDLAATSELLVSHVVLTLVGPGGVGKTALARDLGDWVAPRFRDGVIVCELAALPDDASVLDYVAAQVGLVGEPGADLLRQLAVSLANRRILLLLDNCEHVLASVRALVWGLLGSPGVRILATSREPLAVAEEQLWRVDPLPVANGDAVDAPAVRLFVERARAVDPRFVPTPDLAELCRRLDGLPLAIELTAARMNSLTVAEALRRIDEQPQLVEGRARTDNPRHRSLSSVIDWSYHLLTDVQRAVFDQLAVFPDDFSLDAATHIVVAGQQPDDVAATILDLVERSLVTHVRRTSGSRYGLLDTLRRYGRRHLRVAGILESARDRHAAWYLALAEDLGHSLGAGRPEWIRSLDADLANLRAAHDWFVDRAATAGLLRMTEALHYYALWSLNPEIFDWARRVLASTKDGPGDVRLAAAWATVAEGSWLVGEYEESRAHAQAAIDAGGDSPFVRYGQIALANSWANLGGKVAGRAALYQRAALNAERADAGPVRILAQLAYGTCLTKMGRTAEAEDIVRRMLLEARALGSLDLQAKAMLYLADISIADDPPRAMRGYWSAAELHAHGGNRYGEYQALVSAAFAELLYGDVMRAAAVLRSVLERWPGLLRDTALFCVLQGAVILLVEGERFVSAATLSGAIPADTPMIVFTFDENAIARFDATARVLADVLGDANLAALRDSGRRMHRDEIFAAALAALRAVESAAG